LPEVHLRWRLYRSNTRVGKFNLSNLQFIALCKVCIGLKNHCVWHARWHVHSSWREPIISSPWEEGECIKMLPKSSFFLAVWQLKNLWNDVLNRMWEKENLSGRTKYRSYFTTFRWKDQRLKNESPASEIWLINNIFSIISNIMGRLCPEQCPFADSDVMFAYCMYKIYHKKALVAKKITRLTKNVKQKWKKCKKASAKSFKTKDVLVKLRFFGRTCDALTFWVVFFYNLWVKIRVKNSAPLIWKSFQKLRFVRIQP